MRDCLLNTVGRRARLPVCFGLVLPIDTFGRCRRKCFVFKCFHRQTQLQLNNVGILFDTNRCPLSLTNLGNQAKPTSMLQLIDNNWCTARTEKKQNLKKLVSHIAQFEMNTHTITPLINSKQKSMHSLLWMYGDWLGLMIHSEIILLIYAVCRFYRSGFLAVRDQQMDLMGVSPMGHLNYCI